MGNWRVRLPTLGPAAGPVPVAANVIVTRNPPSTQFRTHPSLMFASSAVGTILRGISPPSVLARRRPWLFDGRRAPHTCLVVRFVKAVRCCVSTGLDRLHVTSKLCALNM